MKSITASILTYSIAFSFLFALPARAEITPAFCQSACVSGTYVYKTGTVITLKDGKKLCHCTEPQGNSEKKLGKELYYDDGKIGKPINRKTALDGNWKDDGSAGSGSSANYAKVKKSSDRVSIHEAEQMIKKTGIAPAAAKPAATKPGDTKSGDTKSGDTKSGDTKSGDTKSGDTKSGDTKSGDTKSGDTKSGDTKSGDTKSGDTKSGDTKSGDTKSGDTKSGDTKSGDTTPTAAAAPQEVPKWKSDSGDHALACTTAAAFAVMAGLRIASIVSISETEEDVCKSIKDYAGKTPAIDTGASATKTAQNPDGTPVSKNTATANFSEKDIAAKYANDKVIAPGEQVKYGNAQSSDYPLQLPQGFQALDGSAMAHTGLDKKAAVVAAPLKAHDPRDAAKRGAGALLRELTGGQLGTLGEGLAQISDKAQREAPSLQGFLDGNRGAATASGSYSSGTNGAAAGAAQNTGGPSSASSGGFFSGFFGGGDAARNPAGTAQTVQFGAPVDPATDIWHSTYKDSIFQIVSDKMRTVGPRVDAQ